MSHSCSFSWPGKKVSFETFFHWHYWEKEFYAVPYESFILHICACARVIAKVAITGHQGVLQLQTRRNRKSEDRVKHDNCFNGISYKCLNTTQTQSFTIPGPCAAVTCSDNFPGMKHFSPYLGASTSPSLGTAAHSPHLFLAVSETFLVGGFSGDSAQTEGPGVSAFCRNGRMYSI